MPEVRRRHGERHARRRRRYSVAGVAVLVVLGVWMAYTAQNVVRDLREARDQAVMLRAALLEADQPAARTALGSLQEASRSAAERTDSFTWGVAERLPLIGDDAEGIAEVSDVLRVLGDTAIPPLVDSADSVSAGSFAPSEAQFPLEQIAALEEPALQSQRSFAESSDRLGEIDSTGFLGPFRRSFDALRSQVLAAEGALDTAARAAQLMPEFLGDEGPRNYLFVFQNNAEARSTAGLPGSISRVRAVEGRVAIVEQLSGAAFGRAPEPALPLTADEEDLFGRQMGTFFLNANFTPDFPRAASLWTAHWEQRVGGVVDGVFSLDPVALSYLLNATGPITVRGVSVGAANVVQVVENQVYLSNPDPAVQDEILNEVAKEVFDVFASGRGNQLELIRGLARGVAEGRVNLSLASDETQQIIAGTDVAGELPGVASNSPQVGVYVNDGTGSKMSYYLDYDATVNAANCRGERQRLLGSFTISSVTPPEVEQLPESILGFQVARDTGIADGQQLVVVHVMSPAAGGVSDFVLDGRPIDTDPVDFDEREVVSLSLLLDPGQTQTFSWSMTSGPGQTGNPEVSVTPGVVPENESVVVRTAC